jgi:hypothetical protein
MNTVLKAWYLYAIIAWSPGPLLPEDQKTLVFGFDHSSDCTGLALQIADQMKSAQVLFRFKTLQCVSCAELYEDASKCPIDRPQKKR